MARQKMYKALGTSKPKGLNKKANIGRDFLWNIDENIYGKTELILSRKLDVSILNLFIVDGRNTQQNWAKTKNIILLKCSSDDAWNKIFIYFILINWFNVSLESISRIVWWYQTYPY